MRWLRANLHTHTINSDGDSPPEDVVAWYRDAGYDALAITDHDLLTDPAELRHIAGPMLLVRGEELTSGDVHVNGLGVPHVLPPTLEGDVRPLPHHVHRTGRPGAGRPGGSLRAVPAATG